MRPERIRVKVFINGNYSKTVEATRFFDEELGETYPCKTIYEGPINVRDGETLKLEEMLSPGGKG